jgi:hypothetical protein
MLTYENFVSTLLGTLDRVGLNIAYTQELIDTHALGRSLSITCLPDGVEDPNSPQEPPLRAVIAFRWSPEFTIFSLRGSDSIDNIELLVDERLFAQVHNGPSLDVEVTYFLPLDAAAQEDLQALANVSQAVYDLAADVVEDPEAVRILAQVEIPNGARVRLEQVTVRRVWGIDEALYDGDLLADTFERMGIELRAMLELLAIRFSLFDSRDDGESFSGDIRYLKPPTA